MAVLRWENVYTDASGDPCPDEDGAVAGELIKWHDDGSVTREPFLMTGMRSRPPRFEPVQPDDQVEGDD